MERISVNKDERSVSIKFDTRFYPSAHVFRAIQDFSGICTISIDGSGAELSIVMKPKSDEIDIGTLGFEFYNYVLGVIKNEGNISLIRKNFEVK
jgi:hypothetical protein